VAVPPRRSRRLSDEEAEPGTETFAERMTRRMRQAETDDLAANYSAGLDETPGCEQDELADYFRSDGKDPLE